MKFSPPFKELNINPKCDLLLFQKPEPKPASKILQEDLHDLWKDTLAKSDYAYIGCLKVRNISFPFCLDLRDKNLPVYSIDTYWSEQQLCLLHPRLKDFYAFMRLVDKNKNELKTSLEKLKQTLPNEIEFKEFWNYLII